MCGGISSRRYSQGPARCGVFRDPVVPERQKTDVPDRALAVRAFAPMPDYLPQPAPARIEAALILRIARARRRVGRVSGNLYLVSTTPDHARLSPFEMNCQRCVVSRCGTT